jgi:hypothetical protein
MTKPAIIGLGHLDFTVTDGDRAVRWYVCLRRQRWQPDVSGAVAWLAVAAWPGADRLGVVIVIARSMPAEQAVGVKVALGLLNGHADDSRTGQPGKPASVSLNTPRSGCYNSPR